MSLRAAVLFHASTFGRILQSGSKVCRARYNLGGSIVVGLVGLPRNVTLGCDTKC